MKKRSRTDALADSIDPQWVSSAQAVLGHQFADQTFLITAFTHASLAKFSPSYERLEFLGDRVLGLILTDYLIGHFPKADQGELTKRYHDLSHEAALARVSQQLSLQKFILHAPSQQELIELESVQSDVVEAVIAALYLDGGFEVARQFILANWTIPEELPTQSDTNPKSELQEWAATQKFERPSYHLVEQIGSAHEPHFKISVSIKGVGQCTGEGKSHKQAEREAARRFLRRFVHNDKGQISA